MPASGERQPFQADHGVAAPIGEPVVAGDHGANLVTLGTGARRVRHAADRRDQELVRGQDHLRAKAVAGWRRGPREHDPAALQLGFNRGLGIQRLQDLPGFRRGDQSSLLAGRQIDAEMSGTPQVALEVVAAALLDGVNNLARQPPVESEDSRMVGELHAQHRQIGPAETSKQSSTTENL